MGGWVGGWVGVGAGPGPGPGPAQGRKKGVGRGRGVAGGGCAQRASGIGARFTGRWMVLGTAVTDNR